MYYSRNKSLFVLALLLSFLFSACSDCVVLDDVGFLDSASKNGKEYHLYYRVSGFQEKVVTLYLYNKKPVFDQCRNADTNEVYSIHIDHKPNMKVSSVYLGDTSKNESLLNMIYTDDQNQGEIFRDIRFTENY